jgi:hypothetical protein
MTDFIYPIPNPRSDHSTERRKTQTLSKSHPCGVAEEHHPATAFQARFRRCIG